MPLIFLVLPIFVGSFAQAERHGPTTWITSSEQSYVCTVQTASGTKSKIDLKLSMYQRRVSPAIHQLVWSLKEHRLAGDINPLHEELLINLVKGHSEVSPHKSGTMTGRPGDVVAGMNRTELATDLKTKEFTVSPPSVYNFPSVEDLTKQGLMPFATYEQRIRSFAMVWPKTTEVVIMQAILWTELNLTPGVAADSYNINLTYQLKREMSCEQTFGNCGTNYRELYPVLDVMRAGSTALSMTGVCSRETE